MRDMQPPTVSDVEIARCTRMLRKDCLLYGGDVAAIKVMGVEQLERYKRALLAELMG